MGMAANATPVFFSEPKGMKLKIGCCGWQQGRASYFRRFRLVEIQQTFYKPPQVMTAQHWREEAPPDFTFTIKAWQLITHEPSSPTYRKARLALDSLPERYGAFRATDEVLAAWETTRRIAEALLAEVVLFQCPASFAPTAQHVNNLRTFFGTLKRGRLMLAWEPRGEWPDQLVAELCAELDLIHVVDPFQRRPVTTGTAYFRLHGRTGYRYRYTDEDLAQLAAWCRDFNRIYCLFNNVSMWDDAMRFQNQTLFQNP